MILTCPACATKYAIADTALGAGGRKVRCVSCGHKWFQSPDGDGEELPEVAVTSFFAAPANDAGLDEPGDSLGGREIPLAATSLGDDDDGFVRRSSGAAPKPAMVAAEATASRDMAWGIVVLVAIVLLLALILPRHKIMALWPNATHLYRTVGLAPKEIGTDLEIRDARSSVKQTADGRLLTIEGEIANTGHQPRPAPDLQAVETNNSATIASWTFPSGITTLAGGKSEHFTASFPATGDTTGNIVLTFAPKTAGEEKNGHK